MYKFILTLFLLSSFFIRADEAPPLSVLIIGGGPAGLASAIEAANHGCNVTVVEKRNAYTRSQPLLLSKESLDLLKQWNACIPLMMTAKSDDDKCPFPGLLRIQWLEKALAKRCSEMGIQFIQGEFKNFSAEHVSIVNTEQEEMLIPYDVLIGADGAYSAIKESVSIQTTDLGSAVGAYVVIPSFSNHKKASKDINLKKFDNYFIRAVHHPFLTAITIQSSTNISLESIRNLFKKMGMKKEVEAIDQGYLSDSATNIPIHLRQAQRFCDLDKSVILIGDATLSVSFLSGDGLNTALSSTKFLGDFLELYRYDKKTAFENYNASMKELTDKIIESNKELFINPEIETVDTLSL